MASSTSSYQTVLPDITAKASASPHLISNSHKVMKKHLDQVNHDISLHNKQEKKLTREDKQWLAELLLWELLFPKDNTFPGIRVSNANRTHTTTGEIPPCRTRNELDIYRTYGGVCPLIRLQDCPNGGHPPSKFRVGAEFDECPDCAQENPMELPVLFGDQAGAKSGENNATKDRGRKESTNKAASKVLAESTEQGGKQEETERAKKAGFGGTATLRSRLPSYNLRKRKQLCLTIEEEVDLHSPPARGTIDQLPIMIELNLSRDNHESKSATKSKAISTPKMKFDRNKILNSNCGSGTRTGF